MPWNNQNGGGPWKPSGQGPWGQGNGGQGGGGQGGGNMPPDLEAVLRRIQERLGQLLPWGSGSGLSGGGLLALALAGVLIWGLTGFYTVGPNEVALNLVFGKYKGKNQSGLNYNWPYPVGSVEKLPVTNQSLIDIGANARGSAQASTPVPEESLMLTGDENIADVKFRVIWQIDPEHPEDYAFNLVKQPETVKAVAESAMREIVGQKQIQKILTSERPNIEREAVVRTQKVLNEYQAGVKILQVQLLDVSPPPQVIAAFKDVTAAQQDLQRLSNEADAYANRVVPEARGAAAAIVQSAQGYREQTVAEAKGQASRFSQIYEQYKKAPDVTRQRMYLETMERVLGGADKIILDTPPGNGTVTYLPLDQMMKKGAVK